MWNKKIHQGSSSYFQLPDNNWVTANKLQSIGRWIEAYNNGNTTMVEKLLRKNVSWSDDEYVYFFAKSTIAFQMKWSYFLCFWDEFLAIEDDCPIIVLAENSKKEALLFRAIGDILRVG